jgi:hypothetical protein
MAKRVLICGDRNWTDYSLIARTILDIRRKSVDFISNRVPLVIIEGKAPGADTMGGIAGKALGCTVIEFPAKWHLYQKAAGPIRNQQMLDEGKPDLVVAFHDDLENSKGTKDMVTRATKVGVEVRIVTH